MDHSVIAIWSISYPLKVQLTLWLASKSRLLMSNMSCRKQFLYLFVPVQQNPISTFSSFAALTDRSTFSSFAALADQSKVTFLASIISLAWLEISVCYVLLEEKMVSSNLYDIWDITVENDYLVTLFECNCQIFRNSRHLVQTIIERASMLVIL